MIPVALGLLWYPLVGRLGPRAMDFLLALTIGLLLFLLVDSLARRAGDGAASCRAPSRAWRSLALGVGGAYLALEALGGWLRARAAAAGRARRGSTALLVAIGIGLHNLGEGLAIGAAFALGEVALGTLLIVGFTLHNTTEGLAIVAPLARDAASPGQRLLLLGLIGGLPTIAGAWLGGFVYSPVLSVLFLALGAGAIAQVIVQIARGAARERPLGQLPGRRAGGVGLLVGFLIMYTTGMLVQ